jgi:hypothetical protein
MDHQPSVAEEQTERVSLRNTQLCCLSVLHTVGNVKMDLATDCGF